MCACLRVCACGPQNVYRSDLNYLRGVAWISTGALQMEGFKRATDLISEVSQTPLFSSSVLSCHPGETWSRMKSKTSSRQAHCT